jgi:hypothetical protein
VTLAATRWLRALACALAIAASVGLSGTAAFAEPDQAAIETQIDKLWQEAEPLIEQYNLVHEQYEQNLARQAELTAQIQPLADELSVAQGQVGRLAAQAYMGGTANTFNALVSADSAGEFVDQMTYLETLAHHQTVALADVLDLKAEYDVQKEPIDALVAQLALQDQQIAAQRADIERRLDELQQLRNQVLSVDTTSIRPWPCPAEYLPTAGYQAASFACGEIGKPYVFGTKGPDTYDCSGLMVRAWQQVGVYLPHNAAAQRRSMAYVNREDLQIGDLVFMYSDLHHVGMYVGDGKIVAAPRTGDVVRMQLMDRRGVTIHSYGRP